jgi:hypothetical protein
MRIDVAGIFILVVAALAAPPGVSQEGADAGSRGSHSEITSVSVLEHADSVDVEVAFSELVQPEVSRLEHPDRLVFDFPGCDLSSPGQRFVVSSGGVVAVSTAAVGGATPVARVVIELSSAQSRARTAAGNKLVVGLSTSGNNLTIELGASGGGGHPEAVREAGKPEAPGQSVAAKSAEVPPPMPRVPPVGVRSDRAARESAEAVAPMPSMSGVGLRSDRAASAPAVAVAPMPSSPPLVLGSDRAAYPSLSG